MMCSSKIGIVSLVIFHLHFPLVLFIGSANEDGFDKTAQTRRLASAITVYAKAIILIATKKPSRPREH